MRVAAAAVAVAAMSFAVAFTASAAQKPPAWVDTPAEREIWNEMNKGAATTPVWKPGRPLLITEKDARGLLEKTYDHAYCTGVPRFGHRGEFPDEEFIVFDCDTTVDRVSCFDARYQAVKTTPYGYFRLARLRAGSCY